MNKKKNPNKQNFILQNLIFSMSLRKIILQTSRNLSNSMRLKSLLHFAKQIPKKRAGISACFEIAEDPKYTTNKREKPKFRIAISNFMSKIKNSQKNLFKNKNLWMTRMYSKIYLWLKN